MKCPDAYTLNFLQYCVCSGIWAGIDQICVHCAKVTRGVIDRDRLSLLKSCLDFVDSAIRCFYSSNVEFLPLHVHDAFAQTGVTSLMQLLAGLVECEKIFSSSKVAPQYRTNSVIVPFTVITCQILDIVLCIAENDLHIFEEGLGQHTLQESYHVFSYLLEHCARSRNSNEKTTHLLLERAILLMGFYARCGSSHQQNLNWGNHPTPLQRLCTLPFKFFSNERDMSILFPTLISVCYLDDRNTRVVEQEISTVMLSDFIRGQIERSDSGSREAGVQSRRESNSQDNFFSKKIMTIEKIAHQSKQEHHVTLSEPPPFQQLFPRDLWKPAAEYFDGL